MKAAQQLRAVRVVYSDGTEKDVNMAAGLSDAEILEYFRVGEVFNIGGSGPDRIVTVKSATILR